MLRNDIRRSKKILVVDDALLSRSVIVRILQQQGYTQLMEAADGQQALEMMQSVQPDLVITDLNMPVMDGFALCEAIRNVQNWSNIPILVQTGMESAQERNQVFAAGATDLVLKPVHPEEVAARVQVHLENQHLVNCLQQYQKRTEEELRSARVLQQTLLPKPEQLEQITHALGVDIATRFIPSVELSGDIWGVYQPSDSMFGFYMLDVCGHGVRPALDVFRLHALLHTLCLAEIAPEKILEQLNTHAYQLLPSGQPVVGLVGLIDTATKTLHLASAGAPLPWLYRNGVLEELPLSGLPLAVVADARYESLQVPLQAGDLFIAHSDALTEVFMPDDTMLDEEVVRELLTEAAAKAYTTEDKAAEAFCAHLMQRWYAVTGVPHPSDDLTMVVCRIS